MLNMPPTYEFETHMYAGRTVVRLHSWHLARDSLPYPTSRWSSRWRAMLVCARARRGTGKRFPTIQRIPFPVFASFTFHFRPPVGHAFHPAPPTTKRTQRTTEHRFPFRAGVAPPWPILQSTAPLRKSYT